LILLKQRHLYILHLGNVNAKFAAIYWSSKSINPADSIFYPFCSQT